MKIIIEDPAARALICVLAAALGTIFASFIGCAAWRITRGESFLTGRSRCDACGHVLGAADLIPIISYIALGGKCRYCGAKIPPRCVWTEVLLGASFAALVLRFGVSGETLRYMGLFVILLGLSLVDLDTFRIPDGFILAGIIWWAVTIPLCMGLAGDGNLFVKTGTHLPSGLLGGFIIAGGMLALVLIFDKVSGKETMGGGDIQLFFVSGLYLGPAVGFFNVILSCVTGLLFVAVTKQRRIPFGPSISLATAISIFVGPAVVAWYAGLF
ncbi:MAG: prepilin peptidase [Lachnospiraceae bacterium]|nr:prepilin peptidase [Lachnospiraceae bacterium]